MIFVDLDHGSGVAFTHALIGVSCWCVASHVKHFTFVRDVSSCVDVFGVSVVSADNTVAASADIIIILFLFSFIVCQESVPPSKPAVVSFDVCVAYLKIQYNMEY